MTVAPVFGLRALGFSLGDRVEVRAFGRWRPGLVTALGRTRISVRYWTRDGWKRHVGAFGAEDVRRPAGGATSGRGGKEAGRCAG